MNVKKGQNRCFLYFIGKIYNNICYILFKSRVYFL